MNLLRSFKIEQAIALAARAHEGQRRKSDDVPYIIHPLAVGFILYEQDCNEDVVIAGILHDTVEDSFVTLKMIEHYFGSRVAEWVDVVTEHDKSAAWEIRKKQLLQAVRVAPVEAKYVYCADKLHNLLSMKRMFDDHGQDMWRRFSRGYEQQKWYAGAALASISANVVESDRKPMFAEFQQLVNEFFK